ncbi:hypothetical protein [Blastopirellula retiformator]|uniref:Bacterial type II secretion system protein G n=1 Tax=Blastopirellula retiformator TaxID=2527970 RepID=A0A5C5VKJ9_9BACT|nr:hypothetical protein [Blastopirellula retiformator]TWT38409.1 hypothetical protein Enr8_01010 [Blastopirellula retiformator]
MTRKAKTYLLVVGSALVTLIGVPAWMILGPPRALVISKETTHLTKPLDAEGNVDYVAAVLERQRAGVTPENNGAIPLLQAMWPCGLEPDELALICDELNISPPAADGLVMLDDSDVHQQQIIDWASKKWGVDLGDEEQYDFDPAEHVYEAMDTPWRRDQIPPLAQWVDDHQRSFELLHEMETHDAFYLPSPSRLKLGATLLSGGTPEASILRDAARVLTTRSMMYIGENQPELAWRDLRLIFILARMSWTESSTVHSMVAFAIEGLAGSATQQLLGSGQCDRALLDEMETFFADLPPIADIARITDQHDRWMVLEMAAAPNSDDFERMLYLPDDLPQGPLWLLQLPRDRNTLLKRLNQRYDEMVTILSLPDPAQFMAAKAKFQSDMKQAELDWHARLPTTAALFSQSVRGIYAGDLLMAHGLSIQTEAKPPQYRVETTARLLRIAIALENFRLAEGEYPQQLTELIELSDAALLNDPYAAGQQLRYERRGEGYLLYSRYENGIDDGGTSINSKVLGGEWAKEGEYNHDFRAVDLVFRFPIPPLVLAKPKSLEDEERELYGDLLLDEYDGLEEPPE